MAMDLAGPLLGLLLLGLLLAIPILAISAFLRVRRLERKASGAAPEESGATARVGVLEERLAEWEARWRSLEQRLWAVEEQSRGVAPPAPAKAPAPVTPKPPPPSGARSTSTPTGCPRADSGAAPPDRARPRNADCRALAEPHRHPRPAAGGRLLPQVRLRQRLGRRARAGGHWAAVRQRPAGLQRVAAAAWLPLLLGGDCRAGRRCALPLPVRRLEFLPPLSPGRSFRRDGGGDGSYGGGGTGARLPAPRAGGAGGRLPDANPAKHRERPAGGALHLPGGA